jgi:hypothetical protein
MSKDFKETMALSKRIVYLSKAWEELIKREADWLYDEGPNHASDEYDALDRAFLNAIR